MVKRFHLCFFFFYLIVVGKSCSSDSTCGGLKCGTYKKYCMCSQYAREYYLFTCRFVTSNYSYLLYNLYLKRIFMKNWLFLGLYVQTHRWHTIQGLLVVDKNLKLNRANVSTIFACFFSNVLYTDIYGFSIISAIKSILWSRFRC